MELTRRKFEQFKKDYPIYKKTTTLDEYGDERSQYHESNEKLHVMWQPVADEAAIQTYGADTEKMLQAVSYDDVDLDEYDHVFIGDDRYEVVSIKHFQTYTLVRVKKVTV